MQQATNTSNDETLRTGFLTLTPAAVEKVRALMKRELGHESSALRVSVVGGGCSGFSYKMGFETEPQAGDQDFQQHGLRVFVDQKSSLFLKGLQIDYVDGLNGSGFVYENPKAAKSCGCGTSFSV
jgi:iron-sulfur cluster assembly protein